MVTNAQALARLGREVGALEGQIRHQPVPENDRMVQRYRLEAGTLAALAEKDAVLVGQAELLRSLLEGAAGDAILAGKREIEEGIGAIKATLRERQTFFAVRWSDWPPTFADRSRMAALRSCQPLGA